MKGNTAFGLLWLELEKLARQALKLIAGLLLIVAILNISLGAAVVLSQTPQTLSISGFTTSSAEPFPQLVHLQLFGGLVHIHEPGRSDHTHSSQSYLAPPGVIEFVVAENNPTNYGLSTYFNFPGFDKTDYTSGWSQNALLALLSVLGLLATNALFGRLTWYNQLLPHNPHLKSLERPPIPF